MRNIILPVDFSDATNKLLAGATKFAKEIGGTIHIVHIIPSDVGFAIGEMGFQYFPEVAEIEANEDYKRLTEISEKIKAEDIPCEFILKKGIPKEVILELAKEKNADYIVMGSHGRSGIYDIFVGSLTKELTKNSSIPVVVIPMHEAEK